MKQTSNSQLALTISRQEPVGTTMLGPEAIHGPGAKVPPSNGRLRPGTEPNVLVALRARDVRVWADGDQLRCDAPAGVMTPGLRDQLRQCKGEILQFLRGPAEVSYAQQRLWFLDQVERESAAYIMTRTFELHGHLDVPALERAFEALIRRHESLRTVFVNVEGRVLQVVREPEPWALPVEDLGAEANPRQSMAARLRKAAARTFDLAQGPLFRVHLLRIAIDTHVLLLTMHHIISDGWSIGILIRELGDLYRSMLQRKQPELPELRFQYRDYVRWQRDGQRTEALSAQLEHWKSRLAGAPQVLDLPTDHPRPPVESHRGAVLDFTLPPELMDGLHGLARRERVTLFTTLLSGFTLLLARYGRQDDLLVGMPVANRDHADLDGIVGLFVNTLVVRADLSGRPSTTQHLGRMREACLDAVAHGDMPLDQLVEAMQPQRDLSRNPLFQVMFSQQSAPQDGLELEGLSVSPLIVHAGGALFDLTLQVEETAGGLHAVIEYATDLFKEQTIVRMAGHWRSLLEAMVASPGRNVWELPMLAESERRQLVVEWNDTAVVYPGNNLCLHQLIEAQAGRTPEQVALVFEDRELTYAELDRRADQLAHYLQQRGVGPDVLVGVFAERSLEMVVGLLGILKAGGAYVPIDPEYPAERIAFMLQDAGIHILLTQEHTKRMLPTHPAQTICLDSEWETIAGDAGPVSRDQTTPRNLAYMIYTSGSTGRPKGALNSHRGICNRLLWMQDRYQLTSADAVLQKSPCSFDVSVWEFFWPLLTGARLVLARPGGHRDPAYLARLIRERGITVIHFVPSMLRALLTEPTISTCASLRHVICSGEALPPDLQEQFFARLTCELHNLYGPTEAAVDVTHWACQRHSESRIVPIGRPVANTRIYILDDGLNPVPIGVAGELYIGGVQVGRGYHNQPELTAQKFVPDPFSTDPDARLYRTGDLARWLPDGNVDYLGRLDSQVKVRGFRIELGEIEHVLVAHGGVKEAVVVTSDHPDGDKRLVAYYVASPDQGVEAGELAKVLREKLPEYMVPSYFVEMEAFPLMPNGKLDRKALPAPSGEDLPAAHEFVPPHTKTEQALATIWSEVLKVGRVGVNDHFFDLGGHSLLAIKVLSRIRDVFAVDLPARILFEKPVLGDLAGALSATGGSPENVRRIESRPQRGPCALSFAQERFWILHQLAPTSPVYNIVDVLTFAGAYDAGAMRRALQELVRRHEILRTIISPSHGQTMQVVLPDTDPQFSELDLSARPQPERQREWLRLVREMSRQPFDLMQAPPFRGCLVHLSVQEHRLLLGVHHILADEWSLDLLRQELHQLYAAFRDGQPSPLPELPIQYADFACWQRDWLQGEARQRELDYWKRTLEGAPFVLELPADKPRPAMPSWRGAVETFKLSGDLLERLKTLGRQHQATLFMTLEAGFAALLHRYTGQEDLLVGTPMSGRSLRETERLIGCFINTVVLRTRHTGDQTFGSLLEQMRARALGAYAHSELPFDQLVAELAPQRDPSRNPLVQVMFLYNTWGVAQASYNLARELQTGTAKFDLALSIAETDEGLEGVIEYSTDLFEAATIQRLAQHYGTLLEAAVQNPDRPLSELELITNTERHQLLVEWNQTAEPGQPNACVHELVEMQALRTPEAVAVTFEDQNLTCQELNRRADQLAQRLRQLGVGPDVLVGICLERSPEMIVALLGTLKTGGAYLPLDPAYPRDRIAFMLEDSRAAVVVTQRSLAAEFEGMSAIRVLLDGPPADEDANQAPTPKTVARSEAPAYVIYTSGSTGKPKGVVIPHRAVVNFLASMAREPGLAADDVLVAVTTLSFDIAVLELLLPLTIGARVVIANRDETVDGRALGSLLERHHATVMQATPVTWRLLLASGWTPKSAFKALVGGEALPKDLADRLLAHGVELWNMYGPTETTVWSTCARVADTANGISIGRPIANTVIRILDARKSLCPIGVPGELCIGGDGVACGYWNRPELTAERFIPDPFSTTPGARLYRTGDRARWRHDGTLEHLGRLDFQIKLRGFRIEVGEIEAGIVQHPAVREAAVIAREDTPGDRHLVAYIVAEDAPADLMDQLRARLRAAMPEYMVPSCFVRMEAFPLTPNGKLDRKALPAPSGEDRSAAHEFVPPRTETEQALAAIWSEVLKVERIGCKDSFFDLGGYSLLAIRTLARIRDALGVDLPMRTLFEKPVLADLAGAVEALQWLRLSNTPVAENADVEEEVVL